MNKINKPVMVNINDIVLNPKNTNMHSVEQIALIERSITKHGWRHPLIVSTRSNELIVGEGRYLAAKKMDLTEVPVDYQDFASEKEEYLFLEMDNNSNKESKLNTHLMLTNLETMDIDLKEFDFEDLGLLEFELPKEAELPDLGDGSDSPIKVVSFTLSVEQAKDVGEAIKKVKETGTHHDASNENSNGNALARIMRLYVGH